MYASLTPLVYLVHAATVLSSLWLVHRLHRSGRLPARPSRWQLGAIVTIGLLMLAVAAPLRGPFKDFLEAYYRGGQIVLTGGDISHAYEDGVHGFVNIPIVAFLFVPFALLPERVAALAFFGPGVVALIVTFRLLVRFAHLDGPRSAVFLVLMLGNGPLMHSLKEGNTSHFALLALVAAGLALRGRQEVRAGLVLGAAAVFKLPLLLYGPWLVVRLRLRAAASMIGLLLAVGCASILTFGPAAHVDWYQRFVASAGERPIGGFNVQSIPALMLRSTEGTNVLCSWKEATASDHTRWIAAACSLVLVLCCTMAAYWPLLRARAIDPVKALDLECSMVGLLACCTSPLAWSHYYCFALLPIAQALSPGGFLDRASRTTKLVWLVATILLSLPVAWPWCNPTGYLFWPHMLLTSSHLIGGLLMLAVLAVERAHQPAAALSL